MKNILLPWKLYLKTFKDILIHSEFILDVTFSKKNFLELVTKTKPHIQSKNIRSIKSSFRDYNKKKKHRIQDSNISKA